MNSLRTFFKMLMELNFITKRQKFRINKNELVHTVIPRTVYLAGELHENVMKPRK